MLPFYKKYWRTAFDIALIALTVYLIMFAFSYFYKIATPIIFSFVIFLCIEPLARRLNKWGIKKSIASGISVLLFSLTILAAFSGAAFLITKQGTALADKLPTYQKALVEQIAAITEDMDARFGELPGDFDLAETIKDLTEGASASFQKFGKNILNSLVGYVTSFSTFIFNFIIGIVLAYFLSIEITTWKQTANEKTPKTFKAAFFFLRNNVFKGIALYIKAQAKMISITFIVILIALISLGVDNAFVIAVVAAILDILPLLGVSALFIPWIIYLFIVGQVTLAIWLIALLLVVTLTRQILEPKITGDSLGVSAFTMLAFMIISLSLFGVAGVIMSPILVILLKSLYDQGYFHRWVHSPVGEYDDPNASSGEVISESEGTVSTTEVIVEQPKKDV
ncbi:sporulation integral membrane protein YtvI [Paenibacillus sp. GSMTC-2017]|uniref:sporulation integral membrane protein YtvI n=1 Tax=Paenibacillus sp. GSMTC-2017 TaxID=2794350 RepID=UPI0018D727D9|nr:sporulation integral membrane protein YtvI [Paenibacillus sp. GSMTC-2017]MBH5317072.1 sporulation integral membrane protein YtvI [Paenibacillus sp. GSMTC-2017]